MTVRPPRSKTFVRESANLWTSSFDPTATILSPSIATACATRSDASIVRTRPLNRIRVGGSAAKAYAGKRPAARAIEATFRNTSGLLCLTRRSDEARAARNGDFSAECLQLSDGFGRSRDSGLARLGLTGHSYTHGVLPSGETTRLQSWKSHIHRPPVRVEHSFLHRLRDGRMRKNGVHQLFLGGFEIHRDDESLNQFGDFGADEMRAEQLAGLVVEDHLGHALILAERHRLAVADERKTTDADIELFVLRGLFGEADGGHLRMAIGAARDHPLVHRMRMQALDRLDADHSFMLSLVGEHGGTGDVADRVDAGHVGPAELVDDDAAALGLYAELLQTDALDIADHTHGRDHAVDRDRFGLAARFDGCRDAVSLPVELRYFGAGYDLHAPLFERVAREGGNLGVLDRQDLRQHFDDGHFRAHGAVERRELDADRAGADDQQRLRHPIGVHRLG